MRKFLLLICVVATACTLWGQTEKGSWESLSTLQAGRKIQVLDANKKKHSGTLVSVSATAILLQEEGGEQSVARQDVRRVKIAGHHRLRNTLIGGVVGAGAGAAGGSTDTLSDMLKSQAQLSYSNQENANRRRQGAWGGIGSLLGLAGQGMFGGSGGFGSGFSGGA